MKKDRWNQNRSFPRDWKVTNERLVVRGKFLLDLDWVKKWPEELEDMNKGKKGHPYEFPEYSNKIPSCIIPMDSLQGLGRGSKKA